MASKRIFITGGASGLGRALAERYARDGWSVCIGDIHPVRAQQTLAALHGKGAKAHALHCDVTRESDLQNAADWLEENWGGVDVVVNNAGVGAGGSFLDISLDDWAWIIDINLMGVVRGCRIFSRMFQKQGGGRFINVASAAGLMHMPLMSSYNATKAAVVALSETLRFELAASNIKVSVVCPTFFRTNIAEGARITDAETAAITERLVNHAKTSADTIADEVYRAAEKDVFLILPDRDARGGFSMKRLLPFLAYRRVMEWKVNTTWRP